MILRYLAFDPKRHGREERLKQLDAIFNQLLMQTAGDVDEALRWLGIFGEKYEWFDDALSLDDYRRHLEERGRIQREGPPIGGVATYRLTPVGERMVRRQALERIFESLAAGGSGDHRTPQVGGAGEESDEIRPWVDGDRIEDIAWSESMNQALLRHGGTLRMTEDDLRVREREQHTGCATVLLIDVSHSMVLYGEDRMSPAREVALALLELITTQYKKDTLDLVLFGDNAERVPLDRVPYIEAGPFHTNTKAGLQLAQELLRQRRHVNKQIFMITDGKPTAIVKDGGVYKNPFGLDEEVVNRTLDEALRCRRSGITVTTFMLARDPMLVDFVEEFTQLNRGRAYFTGLDGLTSTLFVDFVRNRRSRA